jgi:thermitase
MRFSKALVVLALVAFTFTVRASAQTAAAGSFVSAEILVKFRPGVTASAKADAHRVAGGRLLAEVSRTGVQRVAVPAGDEAAAIARYRRNANVLYAEPNYIRSVGKPISHAPGSEVVPGDHYFDEQWALHNTGQYFYCFAWIDGEELCFYIGTPDADIDAPEAWAISTGNAVTVAVIDTGIDYTHPDLAGNYIGGYDFATPDNDPMDDHGHGTHVAGTIAAALNNLSGDPAAEEGVVGVAPNARILAYKVCLSDGTCNDFAITQAIAQAIADGARVINMSLGGPDNSQSLEAAVQDAWNAGLVIVAGAGNDGTTAAFYPAALDHVISVAAFDEDDRRPSFSNYGDWVDISAPGNAIMSTYPMSACAATGAPGDTGCYTWLTGTSMATPHVSGAAALVWSRSDVTSNSQVVDILLNSADPRGVDAVRLDSWTIHGGLNLHNAMSLGSTNVSPVANAGSDQTVTDSGGDGAEFVTLNGSASSDSDGTIVGYEWREGSTIIASVVAPAVWLSVGTHTLTLQVTDDHGATGTDSVVVTVNAAPNLPPVANAGSDQVVTDNNGDGAELVTLNGAASSDSDGTIVTYEWREGGAVVGTGATPTVSFTVGTHTLTLRVTDEDGGTGTDSVVVTVNPLAGTASAHIGDLDGSSAGNKSSWTALLTVTVHNSSHQGVSGAMVTGTWSGAATGSGTCTTGAAGTCVVVSGNVRKRDGSVTFTVAGVTASGLNYSAGQNHDPDGESNGTAITIAKP